MVGADELSPEEEQAFRAELEQLESTMSNHPALVAIQQMEELQTAMWWHAGNAADCLGVIDALNHDGLGIRLLAEGEIPAEEEHRSFDVDLGRSWHNFVASAATFVDHTRRQLNSLPEELQSEYAERKRELLDPHDVVGFVSRFRNVVVHGGALQTGVTWTFTQTKESFDANFRTDILLNRYRKWWNPSARRYIESRAPRLSLSEAIWEYSEACDPLWEWFQDRLHEHHYSTLHEWETQVGRYREVSERLEPGSMPVVEERVHFRDPSEAKPVRPPVRRAKSNARKKPKKKKRKRR